MAMFAARFGGGFRGQAGLPLAPAGIIVLRMIS